MKSKSRISYDINSDQFEYLKKGENKTLLRVDINVLNKRLNETKITNLYTNTKIILCAAICLASIALISIKF